MSRPNDTPVFKEPTNFDTIRDIPFFGNILDLLRSEDSLRTMPFDEFMQLIRDQSGVNAQPKRSNTLETGKKAINKLVVTVKSAPGIVKALVSPRDAPQEQPTILTELASHIEHEEYLTSLLPKTKGSPEHQARADAYQIQQFEHFARFFAHIDPKQRENTRSIHFRHTALAVTPHQFTRAMQILFQDHTTGLAGGILASEMGTGKSYVILRMSYNLTVLYSGPRLSSRIQPNPDFLRGKNFNSWKMGAALPEGHPGGLLKDLVAAVSDLAPDRASDGTALLEAYDAIEPAMTNTPRAIFETHFKRVFGDQLVYRDDRETTFMGSRITDIQNVRPQYISRQTPQSQLHSMRMLIATHVTVGPRDAYFDTLQKLNQNTQLLYLLSMFPSAAKLLLDSPDTPFLELDIRRTIRKEKNTTGESLAGNRILRSLAEKLARSPRSPKLQFILDELDRMGKDRTARPQVAQARAGAQTQETDLALKKMVVITPTLFTAVMLYMILARFHPRTGPLLYHEDLKQSQRSDALRRFNSLRKRDGPWRVFIAPASVASEALNLQIANRLILTSPLLDTHQESQALARVNRVGQSFDVHLKILLLEDSPLDRIVVAHRAGAKFLSDPFNVAEDVSVVNLNADSGSTLI
ncbi:putative snf2 family [Diaporthe ampelina]|uniref:Putative snf2 family n=1 Tax=Diaporthe ampelina TaxID=1214573 RepID=A0A0G2FDK7_9PEZI|nr:putative snf2 family [Diaporthe ampelina]